MKLSNMSMEHVAAVLTTAAIELEPILADKKIMSISKEVKPGKEESQLDYGIRVAKMMLGTITLFSDTYLQGIYRILAAFFKCSPEDVAKKPMIEIFEQVKDSLNDEVFLSFFPSLKSSVVAESSDISPNPDDSEHTKPSSTLLKSIKKKMKRK